MYIVKSPPSVKIDVMKTNDFENCLIDLNKQMDEWYETMEELGDHSFIPAYNFITISRKKLMYLSAKGLIEYSLEEHGELDNIKLTNAGVTYFDEKKSEQRKWLIRDVIVNILISVITSLLVTLLTLWLFKK